MWTSFPGSRSRFSAWMSVGTGVVARNAMEARMIAFDFSVIRRAYSIPSRDALSGPREKIVCPGYVKGRKNQRKRTKPLTIMRRHPTFFRSSRATRIAVAGRKKAMIVTALQVVVATTTEKKRVTMILTLGSSRCRNESPFENCSISNRCGLAQSYRPSDN